MTVEVGDAHRLYTELNEAFTLNGSVEVGEVETFYKSWLVKNGISEDIIPFFARGCADGFHKTLMDHAMRQSSKVFDQENEDEIMVDLNGDGIMDTALFFLAATAFYFGYEMCRQYGSSTEMPAWPE